MVPTKAPRYWLNARILNMQEYLPLQYIDTANELKIIFRHALTGLLQYSISRSRILIWTTHNIGYHRAWTKSGILHRNIHIANLMFYPIEQSVVGDLCD